jgi:hypothetical protein
MSRLSPAEIAQAAHQAGFRGHDLQVAVAVALAESGGRASVNAAGTEDSRGLWQINSVHFGGLNEGRLDEPLYNAKAAHQVWQESKGFRSDPWDAWSTYQNGFHLQYMDAARRGVERIERTRRPAGDGGQGLRPWHLPRHPFQGSQRVCVDRAQLKGLAMRLTELLATVDGVYRRCRWERGELGALNLADNATERKLKRKLDEALDEWDGLRRLPYLMSRDIGYVVEVKRRFFQADREEGRSTIGALITSLHGGGYSRGTRKDVAALLRALYGPDDNRRVRHYLPTSPRHQSQGSGGGGHAPKPPERISLREMADIAQDRFQLNVREFEPFDDVDPVHTPTSWHYQNRAFDASGSTKDMARFADWVADHYGRQVKELFWNGPDPRNIKNGEPVGQWFVSGHTDHVHVAM